MNTVQTAAPKRFSNPAAVRRKSVFGFTIVNGVRYLAYRDPVDGEETLASEKTEIVDMITPCHEFWFEKGEYLKPSRTEWVEMPTKNLKWGAQERSQVYKYSAAQDIPAHVKKVLVRRISNGSAYEAPLVGFKFIKAH